MRNVTSAQESRTLGKARGRQTAASLTCRKERSQPRCSDQRLQEWRSWFLSSCLTQVAMVEATDQGQLDDFAALR